MKELINLARRIDKFCARLNAGMAAIALVLAVLVSAELTVRANAALITALASEEPAAAPVVVN
ncbi:MAG TPA: hypothetical protein VMU87_09500 [Stellaceae bacterium]|nr:hypothetical protein [Stellaceae bacterium]